MQYCTCLDFGIPTFSDAKENRKVELFWMAITGIFLNMDFDLTNFKYNLHPTKFIAKYLTEVKIGSFHVRDILAKKLKQIHKQRENFRRRSLSPTLTRSADVVEKDKQGEEEEEEIENGEEKKEKNEKEDEHESDKEEDEEKKERENEKEEKEEKEKEDKRDEKSEQVEKYEQGNTEETEKPDEKEKEEGEDTEEEEETEEEEGKEEKKKEREEINPQLFGDILYAAVCIDLEWELIFSTLEEDYRNLFTQPHIDINLYARLFHKQLEGKLGVCYYFFSPKRTKPKNKKKIFNTRQSKQI